MNLFCNIIYRMLFGLVVEICSNLRFLDSAFSLLKDFNGEFLLQLFSIQNFCECLTSAWIIKTDRKKTSCSISRQLRTSSQKKIMFLLKLFSSLMHSWYNGIIHTNDDSHSGRIDIHFDRLIKLKSIKIFWR